MKTIAIGGGYIFGTFCTYSRQKYRHHRKNTPFMKTIAIGKEYIFGTFWELFVILSYKFIG
jgi:hypothetical protein